MNKQFRNILFCITLIFLVLFIIFLINQTAGIINIAKEFNPYFGNILLYGLLLLYAVIFISPIIIFLKMPLALHPPENKNSAEFDRYIEKLKRNGIEMADHSPRIGLRGKKIAFTQPSALRGIPFELSEP